MQKQPKNHKYMLSKPFKTPFLEKENWRVDSQLLVVGTTHVQYIIFREHLVNIYEFHVFCL